MHILLPEKVKKILDTLMAAGYEAYAVGGCVRDSILEKTPDDWDITTSANPLQIKALFKKTVDTGLAHGTVTVIMGGEGFEVTTYRIDGDYEDSRHPKSVTFTADILEDLKRRDFTINAMAYNESNGLIDAFGGLEDIKAGIIRCVGEPKERFCEDALRMMRAVRFSAQLGYKLEDKTKAAIVELADNLKQISAERIRTELLKLILSPHPDFLKSAWEMGITAVVLPEFDRCMNTSQNHPHHCYDVGEHTLYTMLACPPEKCLRLGALFHDFGKPICQSVDAEGIDHFYGHAKESASLTRSIMKRLKFDNDTLDTVSELVYYHDYEIPKSFSGVRRAICKMGEDIFPLMLQLKRADVMAQSTWKREEKLEYLLELKTIYDQIQDKKECVSLRTLAFSGKDLIGAGMQPGKSLGLMLNRLLEYVLEDPALNTKENLLKLYESLRETDWENN